MRILASKALYNLVPLDPKYFIENALPYLVSKAIYVFFFHLVAVSNR
jgi:hypothetical protein